MSNYAYINCPYCNFMFKFKKKSSDEGSVLITCPSCHLEFGITEGPPLVIEDLIEDPVDLFGGVTAPVDSEPLFQNVGLPIVDAEDSDESDVETTAESASEEKEEAETTEEQTKEEEDPQPLTC